MLMLLSRELKAFNKFNFTGIKIFKIETWLNKSMIPVKAWVYKIWFKRQKTFQKKGKRGIVCYAGTKKGIVKSACLNFNVNFFKRTYYLNEIDFKVNLN